MAGVTTLSKGVSNLLKTLSYISWPPNPNKLPLLGDQIHDMFAMTALHEAQEINRIDPANSEQIQAEAVSLARALQSVILGDDTFFANTPNRAWHPKYLDDAEAAALQAALQRILDSAPQDQGIALSPEILAQFNRSSPDYNSPTAQGTWDSLSPQQQTYLLLALLKQDIENRATPADQPAPETCAGPVLALSRGYQLTDDPIPSLAELKDSIPPAQQRPPVADLFMQLIDALADTESTDAVLILLELLDACQEENLLQEYRELRQKIQQAADPEHAVAASGQRQRVAMEYYLACIARMNPEFSSPATLQSPQPMKLAGLSQEQIQELIARLHGSGIARRRRGLAGIAQTLLPSSARTTPDHAQMSDSELINEFLAEFLADLRHSRPPGEVSPGTMKLASILSGRILTPDAKRALRSALHTPRAGRG